VIEQQGRVDALDGDRAWVHVGTRSGCSACDAGRGCGAGIFGRLLNRRTARVSVVNRLQLEPGAPVLIGLPERAFLTLVLRLYGWPLLTAIGAGGLAWFAVADRWAPGDWRLDALVLIAAVLAGGLALRRGKRSLQRAFTHLSPVMLDSGSALDCRAVDRHQ
jgi:sigma-E factor negative regulatory protein RseC